MMANDAFIETDKYIEKIDSENAKLKKENSELKIAVKKLQDVISETLQKPPDNKPE